MRVRTSLLALALAQAGAAYAAGVSGVVAGGGYYQGALVCVDRNANGRCDATEPSVLTDASGAFTLSEDGPLVAEIRPQTSTFYDPASGLATAVPQALTFRAPQGAAGVLSAVSTELQALIDANGGDFSDALGTLAARVGVPSARLLEDFTAEGDPGVHDALSNETALAGRRIADAVGDGDEHTDRVAALRDRLALDDIHNIVVIYAENHSFDNLFGAFPGARGLNTRHARAIKQVDRDGTTVLATLPPAWGGLTAAGQSPAVTQAQTTNVWANAPFQIDNPDAPTLYGYSAVTNSIVTRDLYHRFFENSMQIDGGKSDQYVAWADSGGLVMGFYDGSQTQLWDLAHRFTLADNFFQAVYGGSFLNHQYLICACAPTASASFVASNKPSINVLGPPVNGVPQLAANASQAASALLGPTSFKTGNIAPLDYFGPTDGYRAVNTMQPPYQPSGNAPASDNATDLPYANPAAANTLEPQTQTTIGDLLDKKGVSWAWYSGGWAAASTTPYTYNATTKKFTSTTIYNTNSFGTSDPSDTDFQAHHQPFNYYKRFDPVAGAADRAAHLKDRADLLAQIASGTLPAVSFYKPVGFQNQHPGYTNVAYGDSEIVAVVEQLRHSPQWRHMLVVVTYDEFGGQFDHVSPPRGDLLGPGTRIPALIISPFARHDFVDHSPYDTASILRFITHRYSLKPLDGLVARDQALTQNGFAPMGYLGGALRLSCHDKGHDPNDAACRGHGED